MLQLHGIIPMAAHTSLVPLPLLSGTATSALCIIEAAPGTQVPKEVGSVSPIQTLKITPSYFDSMYLHLPWDLELSI